MEIFNTENKNKINKNKKLLEKNLGVKINIEDKVEIEGKPLQEHLACEILEALEMGFETEEALLLKDEDFIFEKINIKDETRRHDLETVRGRIIGKKGMTLKTLEDMTDCVMVLHDNEVGIIGKAESMGNAMNAVKSIIHGLKQTSVYSKLEKRKQDEVDEEDVEREFSEKEKL